MMTSAHDAAMTSPRVDAYLAKLAPAHREVVQALREIVRRAAPRATEAFKWAQPVYEQGGPFCYMRAHKAHVTLGFWRGKQLSAGAGVLEGEGEKMAHLKLRSMAELKPALVERLVREAVALNLERGDPTRGA